MKQTILKLTVLCLLIGASLTILIDRSAARGARNRNSNSPSSAAPQEKTVEQTRKNIKVLTGLPDSQLIPVMNYFAASMGRRCNFCHVNNQGQWDYPSDAKPEKNQAREMIKLVLDTNKTLDRLKLDPIACYTCHRGRNSPQSLPPLPLPVPSPPPGNQGGAGGPGAGAPGQALPPSGQPQASPSPRPAGPSADDILNKHLQAIGGPASIDKMKTLIMRGTYAGANGEKLDYEVQMAAPDKFHIAVTTPQGTIERGFDGSVGWEKGPRGVNELAVAVLDDLKATFLFYRNLKLKEQFPQTRVSGREKIGDRNTIIVTGRTADKKVERLYFDAESGLLLRRISYTQTMVGVIPYQIDFEDYRDVDGAKLPFTVRVSAVEVGNPVSTRTYSEIKLNAPIDDPKFKMPAATKPSGG